MDRTGGRGAPALSAAGTSSSDGMDDDALWSACTRREAATPSRHSWRRLLRAGGDRSAADMALCSHLAFWCGRDAGRMDRIFRRSGLMRDKWDSRRGGSTYARRR
ncbi:MAG: hypothetical protein ACLT98_13270 [Eggerthellaceae bacterium]